MSESKGTRAEARVSPTIRGLGEIEARMRKNEREKEGDGLGW